MEISILLGFAVGWCQVIALYTIFHINISYVLKTLAHLSNRSPSNRKLGLTKLEDELSGLVRESLNKWGSCS